MPSAKNRITPEKRMYFHSELRQSPHCGVKLKRHHTAWHKYVNTLSGIFDLWNMAYTCTNPGCPYPDSCFRSAEADALVMKHTSYGFDVLALVGELLFKCHYTLSELHAELNRRGVVTSERLSWIWTANSRRELRKICGGGIRQLEKQIQPEDSEDATIARDYLAAVRAVLLEDGNPPLELPGVRVYEEALAIRNSPQ